jgi:hypothetical protein
MRQELSMKITLALAMCLTPAVGCHMVSHRVELLDLKESIQPMRERFNAAKDRPRVVALLSPH